MGFFDNIAKIVKLADKAENIVEGIGEFMADKESSESSQPLQINEASGNKPIEEAIVPTASFHMLEEEAYGEDDSRYKISFKVNDAFKEAESHAGEVEMLSTYAPLDEYGEEGAVPYIAIQMDDTVYHAVREFKEKGIFTGAIEITALSGKFYFKAKMEYYEYMMYFYGVDRCDGFWENNGLCMVYPKIYVGTENEIKLMDILDKAAESYKEEKCDI